MFRSFIYLDQEKMYSYLRQIDTDYANQPIEISKKKTRGGSLGTDFFGANVGTEIEEKREVTKDVIKDYDRFEKKLEELAGSEYFDLVLDDYDINTVPRMSIIRVNGSFEIPEQFEMFSVAQNYMPLITSQITTIIIEDEEITIASKMSMDNIEEEYAELEEYNEQEVYMLCKVVGIMKKDKVEIFNPLKDFIKLPRAVRREMDSNSQGMEPILVDGPVLKVEVIAMYK